MQVQLIVLPFLTNLACHKETLFLQSEKKE